jgi:hypothetical protein
MMRVRSTGFSLLRFGGVGLVLMIAFVASPLRDQGVATAAASTVLSGGAEVAFQANTGELWTVGSAIDTADNARLSSGTSPSIIALASGGDEVALQASTGLLWTVGSAGNVNWALGMRPGTSPAIAALAGGGYEVAFQANTGRLWTVGSAGDKDWGLGMSPGTSPAIAGLVGGGYEVAFQANTGSLWTVGSAVDRAWPLGMSPGTSPAIAGLAGVGYEVAFQANNGLLWTVGSEDDMDWKLGMLQHTSPSIVGIPETLRLRIIQNAQHEVGYQDDPVGTFCNYFTAYWGAGTSCGNGNRSEEWCADFAAWAWHVAGAQVAYGYKVGELNASAASFYQWSARSGTWHAAGSGYLPQWGDAAVYGLNASGTYADHVAVVTNFEPGNTGPDVVNGDWWSSTNGGVVVATDQTTATGSDTLSGYAAP